MTTPRSKAQVPVPPKQVVRASPVPAWAQVAQYFKTSIDDGSIVSGGRLPSETQLAADFGVSRITMRQALGHLSAEGYIHRRQGIGTFVAPRRLPIQHDLSLDGSWRERLRLQGYKPSSQLVQSAVENTVPSLVLARLPGVDAAAKLAYFQRVHWVDEEPIGLTESWVPLSVAPGIESEPLVDGSVSQTLRERYGIEAALVDNVVEAVLATATQAQLLQTFVDVPLFVVTAANRSKDGRLVDIDRTVWVAGRVRFHYLHRSGIRRTKHAH